MSQAARARHTPHAGERTTTSSTTTSSSSPTTIIIITTTIDIITTTTSTIEANDTAARSVTGRSAPGISVYQAVYQVDTAVSGGLIQFERCISLIKAS